jgi:hypothetical protein
MKRLLLALVASTVAVASTGRSARRLRRGARLADVKDLVAGSGFDFVARGEHELKGVPGTWRVYAVAEG